MSFFEVRRAPRCAFVTDPARFVANASRLRVAGGMSVSILRASRNPSRGKPALGVGGTPRHDAANHPEHHRRRIVLRHASPHGRHLRGGPVAPPVPAPRASVVASTAGSARALHAGGRIGNIAPGMEVDLVAIDLASTPAIGPRRGSVGRTVPDDHGGDDRAVKGVRVGGVKRRRF